MGQGFIVMNPTFFHSKTSGIITPQMLSPDKLGNGKRLLGINI